MGAGGASGKDRRLLVEWGVHKRRSLLPRAKMLDVADDANDLARPRFIDGVRVVAQEDLLADGIFVGEESVGERLIDSYNPRRGLGIALIEEPPFDEGNS